jgi:hypothetical protein
MVDCVVMVVDQRLLTHPSHLEDQPIEYLLALFIKSVTISLELFMNHIKEHAWHIIKLEI